MIHFAAKTAAETANAFEWAGQPQKLPLPLGGSGPHLIHGFFGPSISASASPKRNLDRFSRFCRAHKRDQHTDKQTDRPRHSVCSNRSLSLDVAATRLKNDWLIPLNLILVLWAMLEMVDVAKV